MSRHFQDTVADYEDRIVPLYEAADTGKIDFDEYDDEYNILLEGTFEAVKSQARLLDAAPELLEALKFFVAQWDDFSNGDIGEAYARARDVITKATA